MSHYQASQTRRMLRKRAEEQWRSFSGLAYSLWVIHSVSSLMIEAILICPFTSAPAA